MQYPVIENIDAIKDVMVFNDGITLVEFVHQSLMTMMNWLLVDVSNNGLSIFMETIYRALFAGKSSKCITFWGDPISLKVAAFAIYGINVVGHVRLVKLVSHVVVHGTLTGVPCQFLVVSKVKNPWIKGILNHQAGWSELRCHGVSY